jgi:hypothetical protein
VNPILRRRIAAVLLCAGAVIAIMAIADLGPFENPPSEEKRVSEAVEDFFGAAAEGRGDRFCGLLTRDARRTLQVNVAQRLRTNDPPSCPALLEVLSPVFDGSSVSVRSVRISGFRARAETRFKAKGGPAQPRTILLAEQQGEWRISDPG